MAAQDNGQAPLLELEEIVKAFPGTLAVDRVSLTCRRGEIHALVGENGAGKSTLMKVLAGLYPPDQGRIRINGQEVRLRSYSEARRAGVGVVYQELSLQPELSVGENIFSGAWPRTRLGLVDWGAIRRGSREALAEISVDLHPDILVSSLPMALRQMVEIAKVLNQSPEILVFDEPTAALSRDEVEGLFKIMARLKERGKGIIFISHRLNEVLRISDRITVMRDGRKVVTDLAGAFDEDRLISSMVGRRLSEIFPEKPASPEAPAQLFSFEGRLKRSGRRVAFEVAQGEVLGLGGLHGQGQLEMLESIFGLGHCDRTELRVSGRPVTVASPTQAIAQGFALIPENRNEEGVFLILNVLENLAAATIDRRTTLGFIHKGAEARAAQGMVERLSIKLSSLHQAADSLSGGNLQKLVLGKWLISEPKVMVMLEPTKGVDVATKQQIYALIRELAARKVAVIVYTSDMLELIGLCDRVLVINQGFLTAELAGPEITEEGIMKGSVSTLDLLGGGN